MRSLKKPKRKNPRKEKLKNKTKKNKMDKLEMRIVCLGHIINRSNYASVQNIQTEDKCRNCIYDEENENCSYYVPVKIYLVNVKDRE